jgi:hypothetical protein
MYERCLAELRKHPERYQPYVNSHNKVIKVHRRAKTDKRGITKKSRPGHLKSSSGHTSIQLVEGKGSSLRRVEHRVVLWSGSSQASHGKSNRTKKVKSK